MQPVRAAREDDASRTIRGSGRHGVRGSWTRISDESVRMADELTRTTATESTDGGEFLRAAQERQRSRCGSSAGKCPPSQEERIIYVIGVYVSF